MFFIISKLLAFLVTPIMWLFALLLFAILCKDERKRKKILLWTIVVFYFLSNAFILDEFMRLWEVPAFSENSIQQPYDAAIVLGGTISYDPTIQRFQFRNHSDRIMQAVLLYRKGKVKKILFSGGAGSLNETEGKEGPLVKSFLLQIGIPESDILIEGESRNTRQNALYTKVLLDKNFTNGKYLLITSASHERRAVKCFEKVGMAVTPYSVDRYSGPRKFEFAHCFIPNSKTLFDWEFLTHEIVGWVSYKLAGYI